MNEKVNITSSFSCKICNKFYSSKSSLCNHNKKFHTNIITSNNHFDNHDNHYDNHNIINNKQCDSNKNKEYKCKKCNKVFIHFQNRWRHEKTCKNKEQIITIDKNQFDNLQNKIKELENKIGNGSVTNNNSGTINNNSGTVNNNSGTINNVYVKFQRVSYEKILSKNEILKILNHKWLSIEESIKTIHFNDKFPEYNNIYVTNLRDNIGYTFNGKQFVATDKNEMVNDLIDSHIFEISVAIDKYKPKLNERVLDALKKFIKRIEDLDTSIRDCNNNNKKYSNYKSFTNNSIKKILYNYTDKKKFNKLKNLELEEKIINYNSDSSTDLVI
jgi:hypothetical protein